MSAPARLTLDQYAMSLALAAAGRTTCIRRGVGCTLVDRRGHIMAVTYNGVASGLPHCNETHECGFIVPEGTRMPAAVKALDKFMPHTFGFRSNERMGRGNLGASRALLYDYRPNTCTGADLPPGQDSCEAVHSEVNALVQCSQPFEIEAAYVTLSSCLPCAKLLLNTSCKRIVFAELHVASQAAEALWKKAGRAWELLA